MRFSGLALYLRGSEESKTNVKEKCYDDLEIKIKESHCPLSQALPVPPLAAVLTTLSTWYFNFLSIGLIFSRT